MLNIFRVSECDGLLCKVKHAPIGWWLERPCELHSRCEQDGGPRGDGLIQRHGLRNRGLSARNSCSTGGGLQSWRSWSVRSTISNEHVQIHTAQSTTTQCKISLGTQHPHELSWNTSHSRLYLSEGAAHTRPTSRRPSKVAAVIGDQIAFRILQM